VLPGRLRFRGVAVAENRDGTRRREVAHLEDLVAEQGVDERGLARVVLPDDDEQEQLIHLVEQRADALDIRRHRIRPPESIADLEDEPSLGGHELRLCARKNGFHVSVGCTVRAARLGAV
jgi:hypothetical protein